MLSSPTKQLAPPPPPPNQSRLIPYSPADEVIYKRRYRAIKEIVYELEDENNLIALKIAQVRNRIRDTQLERENAQLEAERRAIPDVLPSVLEPYANDQSPITESPRRMSSKIPTTYHPALTSSSPSAATALPRRMSSAQRPASSPSAAHSMARAYAEMHVPPTARREVKDERMDET